jgi:hypothetical protein
VASNWCSDSFGVLEAECICPCLFNKSLTWYRVGKE